MCIHVYMSKDVFVYVCVYVSMYMCVLVATFACVFVCICVYMLSAYIYVWHFLVCKVDYHDLLCHMIL